MSRPSTPAIERIRVKSIREDRGYVTPCRVWTGRLDSAGYAPIKSGRSRYSHVHVVVYEHVFGPVIPGYEVHHRCKQKDCHEPLHLVALTPKQHGAEHVGENRNAQKTHCPRGHEYTPENTYVGAQGGGRWRRRLCRTCHRDAVRAAHAQRKKEKP